ALAVLSRLVLIAGLVLLTRLILIAALRLAVRLRGIVLLLPLAQMLESFLEHFAVVRLPARSRGVAVLIAGVVFAVCAGIASLAVAVLAASLVASLGIA